MSEAPNKQKPSFIHKGAIVLLIIPIFSWGGVTLVSAVERIAKLEQKAISSKELIKRIDKNIDKLDSKVDKIIENI